MVEPLHLHPAAPNVPAPACASTPGPPPLPPPLWKASCASLGCSGSCNRGYWCGWHEDVSSYNTSSSHKGFKRKECVCTEPLNAFKLGLIYQLYKPKVSSLPLSEFQGICGCNSLLLWYHTSDSVARPLLSRVHHGLLIPTVGRVGCDSNSFLRAFTSATQLRCPAAVQASATCEALLSSRSVQSVGRKLGLHPIQEIKPHILAHKP